MPETTTGRVVVELDGDGPVLAAVMAHRGGPEPSVPAGYEAPTTRPDRT